MLKYKLFQYLLFTHKTFEHASSIGLVCFVEVQCASEEYVTFLLLAVSYVWPHQMELSRGNGLLKHFSESVTRTQTSHCNFSFSMCIYVMSAPTYVIVALRYVNMKTEIRDVEHRPDDIALRGNGKVHLCCHLWYLVQLNSIQ